MTIVGTGPAARSGRYNQPRNVTPSSVLKSISLRTVASFQLTSSRPRPEHRLIAPSFRQMESAYVDLLLTGRSRSRTRLSLRHGTLHLPWPWQKHDSTGLRSRAHSLEKKSSLALSFRHPYLSPAARKRPMVSPGGAFASFSK